RRRHTRFSRDWSSDVCSSDLIPVPADDTLLRDPAPDGSLLALDAEGFVVALGPDGLERVDGVVQLDPERVSAIAQGAAAFPLVRSEERRVGKERSAPRARETR